LALPSTDSFMVASIISRFHLSLGSIGALLNKLLESDAMLVVRQHSGASCEGGMDTGSMSRCMRVRACVARPKGASQNVAVG